MQHVLTTLVVAALGVVGSPSSAWADEAVPGASVQELLLLAQQNNPDYASMRFEAQAAQERVLPAGALPDPRLRVEWMDITKAGAQNPTLLPGNVGSTRYTLMQDLPWFGKRDLKKGVAEQEAQASDGVAHTTWLDLAARVKAAYAQRYYLYHTQKLSQELLDLTTRLTQVAQVRYAGGLAAQQDVVRAQVEQTEVQTELVALANESRQVDARLNALLARPANAPLAEPLQLRPVPLAQLDTETLAQRVRQHNPQLFTEDARIKSAELARDLSIKNRYPDFTLAIAPTQVQSGISEWGLMLEINIPLQQSTRRAQEREAQAALSAAQARREGVANQVLADLSDNLAGIDAAQRTEQLVVSSLLPQAELTFQTAMAGYENGKLDFATLLDAQRQVRQARQSQLKAQLEAQLRLAEIEKTVGEDL